MYSSFNGDTRRNQIVSGTVARSQLATAGTESAPKTRAHHARTPGPKNKTLFLSPSDTAPAVSLPSPAPPPVVVSCPAANPLAATMAMAASLPFFLALIPFRLFSRFDAVWAFLLAAVFARRLPSAAVRFSRKFWMRS